MSEKDDIALIGTLTKDAADARRREAFTRHELGMVIDALKAFVLSLDRKVNTVHLLNRPDPTIDVRDYASKYVDLSRLIALVDEHDQIKTKVQELKIRLADLVEQS